MCGPRSFFIAAHFGNQFSLRGTKANILILEKRFLWKSLVQLVQQGSSVCQKELLNGSLGIFRYAKIFR